MPVIARPERGVAVQRLDERVVHHVVVVVVVHRDLFEDHVALDSTSTAGSVDDVTMSQRTSIASGTSASSTRAW